MSSVCLEMISNCSMFTKSLFREGLNALAINFNFILTIVENIILTDNIILKLLNTIEGWFVIGVMNYFLIWMKASYQAYFENFLRFYH